MMRNSSSEIRSSRRQFAGFRRTIVHRFVAYCARYLFTHLVTPVVFGAILYSTDFSSFQSGDNKWIGVDGWKGNSVDQGVSGIGTNLVSGLGASAWLGYGKPSTNIVRIYRDFKSTATNATTPAHVRIDAIVGVNSSIVGGNDVFGISFFNTSAAYMASLKFDTSLSAFGVWLNNGVTETFSGVYFTANQLHTLAIEIDFQINVWWAYMDGALLFDKTAFTAAPTHCVSGNGDAEMKMASPTVIQSGFDCAKSIRAG